MENFGKGNCCLLKQIHGCNIVLKSGLKGKLFGCCYQRKSNYLGSHLMVNNMIPDSAQARHKTCQSRKIFHAFEMSALEITTSLMYLRSTNDFDTNKVDFFL